MASGAAASPGLRLAFPRGGEPLFLQARERRVHSPDTDFPPRLLLDFLADRHAVAVVSEAGDREQHDLLELTEERSFTHLSRSHPGWRLTRRQMIYKIEVMDMTWTRQRLARFQAPLMDGRGLPASVAGRTTP